MRLLCALLFLLLCLGGLQGTEGKREGAPEKQPARKGRNRAVPSSGELTSKESHRCTWETSGDSEVTLLVSCTHGELAYRCRYAGRPELCPAYAARSSQYWKQVVGKLKKKKNACDGEKVLKTRVCKKAPVESHMRLAAEEEQAEVAAAVDEAEVAAAAVAAAVEEVVKEEEEEVVKKRGKGGGKKQEAESEGGEKEKNPAVARESGAAAAFGEVNDGNMETEPGENYCAEGWQSFCSFFVKFIDG